MKLIFLISLTLSVFLCEPNLASDLVIPLVQGVKNDNESFNVFTPVEYLLTHQYEEMSSEILDAFEECKDTFPVSNNELMELFQNTVPVVLQTKRPAKCLIDCTMRKTGVMTDEGFQVAEYVMHIKQLMFNFTYFNVSKKSPEKQREIFDAIKNLVVSSMGAGAVSIWPTVIETYEASANECKDQKGDDNCDTSWLIARCVANRGRKRRLHMPFYPIVPKVRPSWRP